MGAQNNVRLCCFLSNTPTYIVMHRIKCFLFLSVSVSFLISACSDGEDPLPEYPEYTYLFWTSLGDRKILRAVYEKEQYLHTDTLFNSVKGVEGPAAIIADAANQRIYWTDFSKRQLVRASWDGTGNPEVLYATPFNTRGPMELVLDSEAQQLYWTQPYDNLILTAPADGTGPVDTLFTGQEGIHGPWGIALSAGYLYWVEYVDNELWRVDMDMSTAPELLYAGGSGFLNPYGVAISEGTGELFITDNALPGAAFSDRIMRGSINGSLKLETVYDLEDGVNNAYTMVIDESEGQLYWHNQLEDGGIYRGTIFGEQPVALITTSHVGQGLALARSGKSL